MTNISQALAIAIQHHQGGRLQPAEQIYRQILQAEPDHPDALHLLGLLAHQAGQHQAGVDLILQAIKSRGNDHRFYNSLGEAYRGLGKYPEAIASYQRSVNLRPDYLEAYNNLATVFFEQGKIDDAVAYFRRAMKINRDVPEVHNNLGAALREQGKIDDAIACHRRALKLRPNYAEAHNNLGTDFVEQRKSEEAMACFRRAIELKPDFAKGHYNLGHQLFELGKPNEAITCYRQALVLQPNYVEAHYNLGIALNDQGKLDEAVASYRRTIELRPDYVEARNNLGNTLKAQGRLSEAMSCFRNVLKLAPTAGYFSNYLMCLVYDSSVSIDEIYAEHVRWGEQFGQPASSWPPFGNLPDPQRRLRVGYLSADFRKHAVSSFIEPLLQSHDHAQFEIFCYSNNAFDDDVTERLKQLPDQWRSITGLGDEALTQLIRTDQIDILVELSGHSAGNRLTALARKPAPVQATYIGYPATTGLAAIDYRFTDEVLNPASEPSYHVEHLYRLPCGSACYVPRAECPEVGELPALTRGFLTFGAPHNLAKMNAGIFDLWAKLLHAIPNSRLAVFRESMMGQAAQWVRDQLVTRGIANERLDLSCQSTATHGYVGYMSKYKEVDICLDTFPANAGTTCCESLWMGVPWLTLHGNHFFGRQTASVLARLGLASWIAQNPRELIEKALYWNEHQDELAEIRRGLRRRFAESTLGNPLRYTRGLEEAYRDIWGRWCESG